MNKFDNEIIISGVGGSASKVIEWCGNNLNPEDWDVQLLNFAPSSFKLSFKDSHSQTLALLNS